jgi:predicted DNA-binding transcriptional regulator AlpA
MAAGEFPLPIRLGENTIAWRESDIAEWLEKRSVLANRRES